MKKIWSPPEFIFSEVEPFIDKHDQPASGATATTFPGPVELATLKVIT